MITGGCMIRAGEDLKVRVYFFEEVRIRPFSFFLITMIMGGDTENESQTIAGSSDRKEN
jgi:hypothetical protein